eukprot:jgi/Psemu1/184837/e_gw1.42.116.1
MIDVSYTSDPLSHASNDCSIVKPSFYSWVYLISIHAGCCLVGVILGVFQFYLMKSDLGGAVTKSKATSSVTETAKFMSCSFVGFATAWLMYVTRPIIESYSPNEEITFMGPFLTSTLGFTTFFKSLNVASGNFPEGADSDLRTWLLWFVMIPEPTFTKGKLSKASRKEFVTKIRQFIFKIIALFIILTILLRSPPPYYRVVTGIPFSPSFLNEDSDTENEVDKWSVSAHINGFVHLWLLYLFVSFTLDFSTLTNYAISGGIRMEPGFCNPLLESRSYKETWGTRWNRPVNKLLKRTVYIPSRKSFGQGVAGMLTFFASGLLHEYNFSIIHHRSSSFRFGEVTLFFILMGVLMVGESWIWGSCFSQTVQVAINRLPSAATASLLTLMVAGVSERYFLRNWFLSGFVEAVAQMMPHVSCR